MKTLVDVMGSREMTNLIIEDESFLFNVSGSVYQSLNSELLFKAKLGGQVSKADFKVILLKILFSLFILIEICINVCLDFNKFVYATINYFSSQAA